MVPLLGMKVVPTGHRMHEFGTSGSGLVCLVCASSDTSGSGLASSDAGSEIIVWVSQHLASKLARSPAVLPQSSVRCTKYSSICWHECSSAPTSMVPLLGMKVVPTGHRMHEFGTSGSPM